MHDSSHLIAQSRLIGPTSTSNNSVVWESPVLKSLLLPSGTSNSTALNTTSTAPTSTSSSSTASPAFPTSTLAGAIVGGILVLAIFAATACVVWRRRRSRLAASEMPPSELYGEGQRAQSFKPRGKLRGLPFSELAGRQHFAELDSQEKAVELGHHEEIVRDSEGGTYEQRSSIISQETAMYSASTAVSSNRW